MLHETDHELTRSRRVLQRITAATVQNKVILVVIIVVQVEFMSNSFCPIKPPKLINWAPSAVDGITGPR